MDDKKNGTYWVTKLEFDLLEAVQTKRQAQTIDYHSLQE